MNQRLSVIGLGYIGLPTAVLFAIDHFNVIGVDINQVIIDKINQGELPIFEPDLDVLLKSVIESGKLQATNRPQPADIFIIAVPTPFKSNYAPDLSFVKAAVKSIAPYVMPGNLIILESTSPVGTTENIPEWICEHRPDLNRNAFHVAYCPERVLPGCIIEELKNNDRIIGGLTPRAATLASDLYKTFVRGECLITDARTAEMAKLTENAFRDVNIAFANELSIICDKMNVNVWELIKLSNCHPRVNILQPGPGVGGHCIAVDPWFIVDASPRDVKLIRAAREVNDTMPWYFVDKIKNTARGVIQPTIACLGLSYKANIDDIRESPAVEIVHKLALETSHRIIAVEPYIKELPHALLETKRITFMSLNDALSIANIIVLLVNHDIFKNIPSSLFHNKQIIDTRGILAAKHQEVRMEHSI